MKTHVISPSSLNNSTYMTYYLYEKVLAFQRASNPTYLDEGTLMHYMLADYYRGKIAVEGQERLKEPDLIDRAIAHGRFKSVGLEIAVDISEDVVIQTFRDYCEYYHHDPFIQEVLAVESPITYELHREEDLACSEHAQVTTDEEGLSFVLGWEETCEKCKETEGFRVVMEMIVDLIFVNPQGYQIWMDHKTRSRNSEAVPLDNQFMAYAYVSGTGRSFRNNIGFQKTLPAEKKFTRDLFPYTKKVLEWWAGWTVYRAQYISSCIKENHFPPDFTRCKIASAQCTFVDVCMQNPGIDRERFLIENFAKRPKRSIYDGDK